MTGVGMKTPASHSLFVAIVLAPFSAFVLLAAPGARAFQCGDNLKTYSVRSLGGIQGTGIRCVMSVNPDGMSWGYPYIAWYGEGTLGQDGSSYYRHLGHAFATSLGLVGSAADISGNGESSNSTYDASLFLVLVDNSIRVRGAWNEQWDLVDDAPYTPIADGGGSTCGPNFKTYWSQYGGHYCVLQNGDPLTTWLGVDGPWGWRQLGSRSVQQGYVLSNICPLSSGDRCYNGYIDFTPQCGGGYSVSGHWYVPGYVIFWNDKWS